MADVGDRPAGQRRVQKSPEAFRTISEVASDLDVPQHVLRFWESKFSQIRPLKRGGGRRYYRPEDVDLLRGIRRLLYTDGYTIKGVQKLLREQGAKSIVASGREPTAEPIRRAESTGVPQGPSAALSDAQRKKIASVLTELTELRQLLSTARQ